MSWLKRMQGQRSIIGRGFTKTKYVGGTCTELTELVDADRFSYTVLMEYVKGDLGYSEIGGVYIKRVPQGWKLVDNDGDLNEYIQKQWNYLGILLGRRS